MILQVAPYLPIQQYGASLGSTIICTGLFIWAQVQNYQMKKDVESYTDGIKANTETVKQFNNDLRSALEGQVKIQTELAHGVQQLAEAVHRQSETQVEQLALLRDMVIKQEVLSANQTTLTTGLQRVVEQLIEVVRG